MELTVAKKDLLKIVARMQGVAERKSTMPVLANVLLAVDGNNAMRGKVTVSDVVAGHSYTISGEGTGGVAGFAKGGATVTLSAADGGTSLDYAVEASVGGKIAQLGSRLIDGFARKLADQFFVNFQAAVEPPAAD